jgi:hypothetical protein
MLWRTASFAETSVARVHVGYFLEDRAHEGFLKALVTRVAQEEGFHKEELIHDVRSSRGGAKSIDRFRDFLREHRGKGALPFDLLVVARDGNCHGYNDTARELKRCAELARFPAIERIVLAIPDPHIERWYLIDGEAFKKALGTSRGPDVPAYKCERAYYKRVLRDQVQDTGIRSSLGGVEYGGRIAENMADWYHAGEKDIGFKHFCEDLRQLLRKLRG